MFSVYPPAAGLTASGKKRLENRPRPVATSRPFKPGTWIGIHESKNGARNGTQADADRLGVPFSMLAGKASPNKGKLIAIGQIGSVIPAEEALRDEHLAPWADPPPSWCIVWATILRLHTPIRVTGGQGTPLLSNAVAKLTTKEGEQKTKERQERAIAIRDERLAAAAAIYNAIAERMFDIAYAVDPEQSTPDQIAANWMSLPETTRVARKRKHLSL